MAASAATVTTAGITPELFPDQTVRSSSHALIASTLILIVIAGLGFRVFALGAEALSEDELNKIRAVQEYRTRGLTSANSEHPLLMKALLTASIVAADYWNGSSIAQTHSAWQISIETAARIPVAVFGALTALLVFLVALELFGVEVGLIAAALWALDPAAIGFNRIAKEDSFFVFFFLLANVFWLRSQRVAEVGRSNPEKYYWLSAAAFGAMLASKYYLHLFGISISYYHIFQGVKAARWRLGKRRWLIFFAIMGATFLLCNPAILLPSTWHEIRIFAGEKRIGHDAYEFMGQLYRNQMSLWMQGSPWYFYFVFMGVKLPLLTLAAFVVGLPLLFLKRLGDGRYFILFWIFFWFFPFSLIGGKFTRYFTFAVPVMMITAAIGVHAAAQYLFNVIARAISHTTLPTYLRTGLPIIVLAFSAHASASTAPHYRLYTNMLGGGMNHAGYYFPHDEFYDSSIRDAVAVVAANAPPGTRVASETPGLFDYYAQRMNRDDLVSISLSDPAARRSLVEGDYLIIARGRRYFSNDEVVTKLRQASQPAAIVALGVVPSVEIFVLNQQSRSLLSSVLK